MASAKATVGAFLGRFVFRQAQIVSLGEPATEFRRLSLQGSDLRDVSWTPGDKIQVFLPEHGMRTYTPLSWDSRSGSTELLVYLHGDGPGAAWGRAAQVGDALQFFGPRRSIDGRALPGRVVLFGDETSFAVASALRARLGPENLACVFELSSSRGSQALLSELDLAASVIVPRREDDSHLDAVHTSVSELLDRTSGAQLVLTGRARAIQLLRARLKRSPGGARVAAAKAYWARGKRGLD